MQPCCCLIYTTVRIAAAGETSNKGKDCWQWVKVTHRSQFTSAAIPNHRAPALWTDTFSFAMVSSTLISPPRLSYSNHFAIHQSYFLLLTHITHNEGGSIQTLKQKSILQHQCSNHHESSNTGTPRTEFYWSLVINAFYFLCLSRAVWGIRKETN